MGTSFGIRVDSGTSKFAIDNIITFVSTDEYTGYSIFDSSANDFGNAVLYSDRLRYANLGKCSDDGQYNGKVYEYTIKDGKVNEDVISTFGNDKNRISIILAIAGNGDKLAPMMIFKIQPGKTNEKKIQEREYAKNKKIFVCCQ